nr:YacL family protein [Aggregatibacter actinomycetemcomitans]
MNFQFTAYQGNIIAKRSMEHSAFANRFNIEVRLDPQLISTALSYLENPPAHRSSGGIGRDRFYYNVTIIAFCGIENFARFLHPYLTFIRP